VVLWCGGAVWRRGSTGWWCGGRRGRVTRRQAVVWLRQCTRQARTGKRSRWRPVYAGVGWGGVVGGRARGKKRAGRCALYRTGTLCIRSLWRSNGVKRVVPNANVTTEPTRMGS